jgi:ring-1,2-phenylacetyl-CoA epoxidase subunit PaaD
VPDPEIPVLSLVDLGVIRGLRWEGGTLVASITPTYSGCPATAVIEMQALAALTARLAPLGLDAEVERCLSPPWTSDWIGAEARAKLEAYGIAPPAAAGPSRCPHCGGERLERVSQFGSTPCKAQWRCLGCLEPFDHFKCH